MPTQTISRICFPRRWKHEAGKGASGLGSWFPRQPPGHPVMPPTKSLVFYPVCDLLGKMSKSRVRGWIAGQLVTQDPESEAGHGVGLCCQCGMDTPPSQGSDSLAVQGSRAPPLTGGQPPQLFQLVSAFTQ